MKRVFFITLMLISNHSFSNEISLQEYCEETASNRKISKIAMERNGKYGLRSSGVSRKSSRSSKSRYYRGCRYDTKWLGDIYEAFCDGSGPKESSLAERDSLNITPPENFLFFFEGAGDFNAKKAVKYLSPVNIDGSEGIDLGMGNFYGGTAITRMYNAKDHGLYLAREKESIELHYHASSGFHSRENYASALACAKEIKKNLDVLESVREEKVERKWIAMGFSNGGLMSINFQNDMAKLDVGVSLTFTMDPVVQTVKFPVAGFSKAIGKRNLKTKRLVNVYQRTDRKSMPVLRLRGKPVIGADVNFLIDPIKYKDFKDSGVKNHLSLPLSKKINEIGDCEFRKAFSLDEEGTCDGIYLD